MAWSIEAVAQAPLSAQQVWAFYGDPSTWGEWGHNTRWARARGPIEAGATVDVKAGYGKVYPVLIRRLVPDRYIECEVRPPGMLVVNSYAVEPVGDGVQIRHGIEVSGRFASIARAIGFDRLYTRLLQREIARLIVLAGARR
jgi:Polyketide cyclase / dehydrase and lipid transport